MTARKNSSVGSTLESLLIEEGILEEVHEEASRRVAEWIEAGSPGASDLEDVGSAGRTSDT